MQTVEKLEEKLDQFQGLEEVRINIHAFIQLLRTWKDEEHQQLNYSPVPLHFIFGGEPGTGKTQAAELMGQIYHALGFLSEGNLVKADAADLTTEVVEKSIGNILFLSALNGLNQNTAEFLETVLNQHRENFVIILKGTQQEVQNAVETFPVLRIRFCKCLNFTDKQEQKPPESSTADQQKKVPKSVPEAEFAVQKNLDANIRTGTLLQAGARLDLTAYLKEELRIRLIYQKLNLPMEMDAYVFLLHEHEMTSCDEDMIFFGNLISQDNGAAIVDGAKFPETAFILNRIYPSVQKIVICFSAYGDNPEFDFSQVEKPVLQIFHGEEQIAWMNLQNLKSERTLVAAELYRYQNTWKFRAVSAGYRDGLEQLCQRFGIEVE